MTCPSCGHTNDPGNRFCEYCGARLDPSLQQEATVQQIGPPSFGNDASYDAPTMFVPTDNPAPPPPVAQPADQAAAPAGGKDVICGVCGYANQPGDRFCDQCGASLQVAAADAAAPATPAEPATPADVPAEVTDPTAPPVSWPADPALASDAPTPPGGTPVPNFGQAAPAAAPDPVLSELVMRNVPSDEQPTQPAPVAEEEPVDAAFEIEAAPAQPTDAPAPAEAAAPVEAPAEAAAPAATQDAAAPAGDRASLEAAVQEHRDNLAMFEQMAARYAGREVPTHITAGLEESRNALALAELKLKMFDETPPAPAEPAGPDPAEVERLNNLIQEQRDNLAMFEQMAARYAGRDVPAHITAGLEESRNALAQAEADLANLGGAPAATPPAPSEAELVSSAPVEPAGAEPAIASFVPDEAPPAASAFPPAAPAEAPPIPTYAPPAQPTPAPMPVLKPRLLVTASGATIELPSDKTTIVIGREDPISGIFPEVDLTPHGGEGGGVSRQHARILRENGGWKLEDLNSTNYTKVNGTKLAAHTPTELKDGDQVQFGRVALTFHIQ